MCNGVRSAVPLLEVEVDQYTQDVTPKQQLQIHRRIAAIANLSVFSLFSVQEFVAGTGQVRSGQVIAASRRCIGKCGVLKNAERHFQLKYKNMCSYMKHFF